MNLFLPKITIAQNILHNEVTGGISTLNNGEMQVFQKFVTSNFAKNPKVVQLKALDQMLEPDGSLILNLPNDPFPAKLSQQHIEVSKYGVLSRTFQSADRMVSYIHLEKDGYQMSVLSGRNNEKYIYSPLNLDKQILFTEKANPIMQCGNPETTKPQIHVPQDITPGPANCDGDQNEDCQAVVNVLFLVPPDVMEYVNSFYNPWNNPPYFAGFGFAFYMGLQQEVMRIIMYNSNIKNKTFVYSYKFISDFPYNDNNLATPDILKLKELYPYSYRQQNNADLLFLLTARDYGNLSGKVIGIPNNIPEEETAYGLVRIDANFSYLTMHHEVAHLLGCRHAWTSNYGDDDNNGTCAHGRMMLVPPSAQGGDGTAYPTVMANLTAFQGSDYVLLENSENSNDPTLYVHNYTLGRIPHFSDPEVIYNGTPTGSDNNGHPANNARQIRNAACKVAEYVPQLDFHAILGFDALCRLFVHINPPNPTPPGVLPYTFKWYRSYNGNPSTNTWIYIGEGSGFDMVPYPIANNCFQWVRCDISAANHTFHTTLYMNIANNACSGCNFDKLPDTRSFSLEGDYYPNPVAPGDYIWLNNQGMSQQDWSSYTEYQLYHISGSLVASGILEGEAKQIPISSDVPSGQYYMIVSGDYYTTRPNYLPISIISKN